MSPRPVLAAAIGLAVLTGCGTSQPVPSGPRSPAGSSPQPTATLASGRTSASATTTAAVDPPRCAARVVSAMSLDEKIGQLVMVGVSRGDAAEVRLVKRLKLGSVIVMGNHVGADSVAAITGRLSDGSGRTPVLIAVDQEGGLVQRLKGAGFDTIPSARVQAGYGNGTLRAKAQRWAEQLRAAGVHWDLAPVADTVPGSMVRTNKPIGALGRGYGSDPSVVADKVSAVVRGMASAGVATSAKHFPGIGRVVGNTDFSTGVKDTVTRADDPYLKPFRAAVRAGVQSLMVSTVTYTQIDPRHPAVYSPAVIGLIRRNLGFDKVVISDDLGVAKSVSNVPVNQRAVRFVAAGGDVAITVDPALADDFVEGLRVGAGDPAMARSITQSATRVVELKVALGLVRCGG